VPAQEFQREKILNPIAPRNRQLAADFLNCRGLEGGGHSKFNSIPGF
jgi:hypothetical protein